MARNSIDKIAKIAMAKEHMHHLIDQWLVSNADPAHKIREFTHKALELAPDYFFTRKASTTGKHHHGESLLEHTHAALIIGKHIVCMMQEEGYKGPAWDGERVACFYSAVILHDIFASGVPGRERRDPETKELRTDHFHMVYPQQLLRDIEIHCKPAWRYAWYGEITDAIAYHYGPWAPLAVLDPRGLDSTDLRLWVFIADYFSSRDDISVILK